MDQGPIACGSSGRLLLGEEAAQGQIISQVEDLAGSAGAQAVQAAIESARNAGSSLMATSLGAITLLFGLWGVFGELPGRAEHRLGP